MDRNNWQQFGNLELALKFARRVDQGYSGCHQHGIAFGFALGLVQSRAVEPWEGLYVEHVANARRRGVSA